MVPLNKKVLKYGNTPPPPQQQVSPAWLILLLIRSLPPPAARIPGQRPNPAVLSSDALPASSGPSGIDQLRA